LIKFVSSSCFPAKSVEQLRVEQSQFEQFTPTQSIEQMKWSLIRFDSMLTREILKGNNLDLTSLRKCLTQSVIFLKTYFFLYFMLLEKYESVFIKEQFLIALHRAFLLLSNIIS
jgi:hypothetical protein